ncbi:deoxyribonuclease IV [Candidatus Falkowbacteria bacterium]|nr:deoxyribonuclease IV [Candidatus Falkowbacteria bacterium]
MKIGAHISAATDIALAPSRARKIGGECFQFFSRPPQGGQAKPITQELAQKFKANLKKFGQAECYLHTPYFINLASANNRIYHGSIKVIREELERGSQLGVKYLMTHLGSAKDLGEKAGLKKVVKGLAEILKNYQGATRFLIEMSAGSGAIIGDTFEEIKKIISATALKQYDIGVCFDTAHAFASGYDLKDKKAVEETFKKFNKIIGLKKLILIHANDTKVELGSHKDRHEHIGEGKIGLEGFKAIVSFANKQKINMILETPHDGKDVEDIKILKKLRETDKF